MNYKETLDFLFAQLPMYQRIGSAAYKADLNNTLALMSALNNPENKFKSIHVAGTNGKGSTAHMIASVLQEAGYKTGLYTSPHLIDFRERIKINGEFIPEDKVVQFVQSSKGIIETIKPSFFELTVGMAFEYFAEEKVDIAVIEVGLGGRLDSTNVIQPEVSVITNIGIDHTQFLGKTRSSIAKEKAGIIKKNTPLVIGKVANDIENLFRAIATKKKAPIHFTNENSISEYKLDLKGNYQVENQKTAELTLKLLIENGWKISAEAIKNGLKQVSENTGLRGRWEQLSNNPKIICDTGHNVEGIKWISNQLFEESYETLHMVIGMVNDKDPEVILELFPNKAQYYFCESSIPRKLPLEKLVDAAKNTGITSSGNFNLVSDAYNFALSKAKEKDLIFIGGSTFVVADLLNFLGNQ
jgi:dihydrofolate synthase/folylpolyglutamate synthase